MLQEIRDPLDSVLGLWTLLETILRMSAVDECGLRRNC